MVKEVVVVPLEETRGEWEVLNEAVPVMHMVVLRDKVTVTLAVKEVLALTEVEPDDDPVVIKVLVTVPLIVMD